MRWPVASRIDFFDDPAAPKANSIVPSANVVVVNERNELLLIHRTDNDNWALPGGAQDFGESLPETAVRETREEAGVEVEVTGLVGIYTDPRHVVLYTSNGEARQEFSVVFTARPIGGEPTPSDESSEVRWVDPEAIGSLTMHRSMRLRIERYLSGEEAPHLG
jgi:ADP-ribose pyrophosphatase YjhB (NUDIX family)